MAQRKTGGANPSGYKPSTGNGRTCSSGHSNRNLFSDSGPAVTGRAPGAPVAEGPQRPDCPTTLAHAVAVREVGAILVERIESGEFEARQRQLAEAARSDPCLRQEKTAALNSYERGALETGLAESENPTVLAGRRGSLCLSTSVTQEK